MPRATGGTITRRRHKKVLEQAKGYFGRKSKNIKIANQQVMKSLDYAYRDRRAKKGDFRRLWIARINAAARLNGMSYNRFIDGLKKAGVEVDRKILAELAVNDAETFRQLVQTAKAAI